ncbi:MAG TPA: TRAP transporter substrate-binding protein [Xanthobacteraceae bacterium]|jgi:TRAP-type C4-dicarboxylate transport system substrate-binding protein
MNGRRNTLRGILATLACGIAASLLVPPSLAHAQAAKTYVMKLSTATINDTQHEWLRRFVAAVEKDSGGRIKGEIYPASQLGSIPRQIEGVQFGSIQGWIGPPEFLVGVDERYEALSAPGLFTSEDQDVRVINDPTVRGMVLGLGANKGLVGAGIAPIGPSSIASRKPIRHLADFKGTKIRVLASPFQLEMVKRMDASPVAMTLADVMPALQQGAIDAALATITVYTTMQYQDAAKYVIETDQPYLNSIIVMSKKWLDSLPPDLQKIVRDDAAKTSQDIVPFVKDFFAKQRKVWSDKGGELISLPAAEQAAMVEKISSIGDDLSKNKPELNKAVKTVFESAKRYK